MQFIKGILFCFIAVVMAGVSNAVASASPDVSSLEKDFYSRRVQQIFDDRCLACHSCFNAPCQMNLQSYEGFERGASKLNVYDGTRMKSVNPTRLWVDAHGKEWRKKGFFDVNTSTDPQKNLFFQMLELRTTKPTAPVSEQVADSQICAKDMAEFTALRQAAPELGMPYGFPALSKEEMLTLETWIKAGAPGPEQIESESLPPRPVYVREWEEFLNRDSRKQKLVSRYIYEHLFLAHIYFPEKSDEFYSLVRSKTACDEGVEQIASRRPNDSPGRSRFWYCLKKFPGSVVMKTHIPYEWSSQKRARYEELFFKEDWKVTSLPGYEAGVAENPFVAFQEIPVRARYQFLLDDSHFIVSTFIKGPVCNGSMAVNAIQEQFYVFFLNPDADKMVLSREYERKAADLLMMPGVWGSEVDIKETPIFYKKLVDHRENYRKLRTDWQGKLRPGGYTLKDLWNGEGVNRNAALTVFRHDDNAVVVQGAVGDLSKTAFVLDYPLLERLVYNLVVNFDVFGNISHQFLTRVYMDMIRMEAEELFLAFLPPEDRLIYRREWYRGIFAQAKMSYMYPTMGSTEPTGIKFVEDVDTKKQLVQKILFFHLNAKVRGPLDFINWKALKTPDSMRREWKIHGMDRLWRKIASDKARGVNVFANHFPELSLVKVKGRNGEGRIFSIVHNREHENISFILGESLRLDPREDSLTVHEGVLGAYPNMIYVITEGELPSFVSQLRKVKSEVDYQKFAGKFGLLRSNPHFWQEYDELHHWMRKKDPVNFGILDLTRYQMILK